MLVGEFGENLISKGDHRGQNWPARSPDLTAPDFFLWSYLKDRVYKEKHVNVETLKRAIVEECRKISPEMLHRVMHNGLMNRIKCIEFNGEQVTSAHLKSKQNNKVS